MERQRKRERESAPTGYKILLNDVSRQAGIFTMSNTEPEGLSGSHVSEKNPETADRARPKGVLQIGGRHDIAVAEKKLEGCTYEGLPVWTEDQMLLPPHPPTLPQHYSKNLDKTLVKGDGSEILAKWGLIIKSR